MSGLIPTPVPGTSNSYASSSSGPPAFNDPVLNPIIRLDPLSPGPVPGGLPTTFHVARAGNPPPPGGPGNGGPAGPGLMHPLKLHHDGKLKDIPVSDANQLAALQAKRNEFAGLLNALVNPPGGAAPAAPGQVTAFRYQFSKQRVIYYAGGQEHILKMDSSNDKHHAILGCIGELEDMVFQIRGVRITYSSYDSESVMLTGKVSPHYKVMTPVLTRLAKSSFEGGMGLALRHYRRTRNIPPGARGTRIGGALGRLTIFKGNLARAIRAIGTPTTANDKKKLAALKALKDKLDNLNGRDGYQLAWTLLIDLNDNNGIKNRDTLIGEIEAERGHIEAQWRLEENADNNALFPRVGRYFSSETNADRTARENARRKAASLDFSAEIAGLVFSRAFPLEMDKARVANEQYRSKNGLYGQQRVELDLLIRYLANDRDDISTRDLLEKYLLDKGVSQEAYALAQTLIPFPSVPPAPALNPPPPAPQPAPALNPPPPAPQPAPPINLPPLAPQPVPAMNLPQVQNLSDDSDDESGSPDDAGNGSVSSYGSSASANDNESSDDEDGSVNLSVPDNDNEPSVVEDGSVDSFPSSDSYIIVS